jgi:hypothetical protein
LPLAGTKHEREDEHGAHDALKKAKVEKRSVAQDAADKIAEL